MAILRQDHEKILVDCYAIEVYLPAEYVGSEYRGTKYYAILGNVVKYYGLGNFRVFTSEAQFKKPDGLPVYVLGIPMVLSAKPSEIDVREVQFTKGGPIRKCVVLTFYKNDEFLSNNVAICHYNQVMMLMGRITGGKMTYIPPHIQAQIIPDAERMNKVNLRFPPEEMELFLAERYRNPNNQKQKLRFSSVDQDSDDIVSYRMREEAMQTTTYQAVTHEDINNALITSVNRTRRGEYSEPTMVERITRGLEIPKEETAE